MHPGRSPSPRARFPPGGRPCPVVDVLTQDAHVPQVHFHHRGPPSWPQLQCRFQPLVKVNAMAGDLAEGPLVFFSTSADCSERATHSSGHIFFFFFLPDCNKMVRICRKRLRSLRTSEESVLQEITVFTLNILGFHLVFYF